MPSGNIYYSAHNFVNFYPIRTSLVSFDAAQKAASNDIQLIIEKNF